MLQIVLYVLTISFSVNAQIQRKLPVPADSAVLYHLTEIWREIALIRGIQYSVHVKNDILESNCTNIRHELEQTIKEMYERHSDEIARLTTFHTSRYDELMNRMENESKEIEEKYRSWLTAPKANLSGVSFSAKAAKVSTNSDNGIIYDTELNNEGHAYSKTSGVFTVPVTGIYLITWSSASCSGSIKTILMKNGSQVQSQYNNVKSVCGGRSMNAILPLSSGDRIWIKRVSGTLYADSNLEIAFSGFKLN